MARGDRAACDCDDCMVGDTGRSCWGTCGGGADALGPAVLGLGGSAYPALDPTAWSMTALLDARELQRGAPGYIYLDAGGVCSYLGLPGATRGKVTTGGPCIGEGTHWQCGRTYRYGSACCCPCCDDATGAKSQLCSAC